MLKEHATEATSRVGAILAAERPLDVFVPYFRDPMPDHAATHGIVMAALRRHGERTGVYEYPVWFWRHWPWTGGPHLKCRGFRRIATESVACTVRFLRESRRRVRIGDVADDKRAALEQHRSQMTRLGSNPQWQILDDVWEGDFLRCFFNEYERFVMREFCPG